MARQAFSSAEKATVRAHPHVSQLYAAVHQPRIVWAGNLSDVPTTYPGSAITATGTTQGNLNAILTGMTLRIGTEAGKSDLGRLRIRTTPGAGSIIRLAEFGSGLIDWRSTAKLAVVEEYQPWPIHHSYDTAGSQWLVDLNVYNNETRNYGPMALLGPPAVTWIEGGKGMASYVGDRSYSFTVGASITSQTWAFPNGQTVTSVLGSSQNPIVITYLNASSGGAYHTLMVTDGNGASHIGQRLTFAFNSSNAQPPRVWIEEIAGGLRSGGYRGRIHAFSNATSDMFPDGAQVIIFERASFNGIASNIGGNFFGRGNIIFSGWISDETVRIEPFTGEVSFAVETIDGVLGKTDAYDLFLESGSAASAWDMASGLTIDRAAIVLAKYRSTVAAVTDVNFVPSLASNTEAPFRSLPTDSLWGQFAYNYAAHQGIVAADLQSSIYMQTDAQVDGGSAALPVVMDIGYADRRDAIQIQHPHRDANARYLVYAISGGDENTYLGGVSPSERVGYFGRGQEITRNSLVTNQQMAITWAGNLRARENNPYKLVTIPLAGNIRIDSVPQCRIQFTASPTDTNNLRGLNWSNTNFLPTETRLSYHPETPYLMNEITAEMSVNGIGGSSVDFPPIITPLPTPDPTPIPPPGGGGGQGGLVYFVTQSFVGRTRNWNGTSPSWKNITGTISGTITDFILDPYDPLNNAWCTTTTAIYRTTNLNAASPTWVVKQSQAQIESAIGGPLTSFGVVRMCSTITANGKYAAFAARDNFDDYVGVTTNNGSSWTWTLVSVTTGDQAPSAMDFSDHDENIIVVACDVATTGVFRSTNGGSSYTALTGIGTAGATDVLIPYAGNDSDAIIYICTLSSGGNVYKTTNTGISWTEITPSGFSLVESVPPSLYGVIIGDATTVYVVGSNTTSPLWKSTDGGSSWVMVNSDVGANARAIGLWPYDANKIYMALDDGGPYFSINSGASFSSKLGNWATAVGSVNNARTLVPVWTV